MKAVEWKGFKTGSWTEEIDVRSFILANCSSYQGDESFLSSATPRTRQLFKHLEALLTEERERGGVLDIDTHTVSSVTAYEPGYLDRELELIVGLQTDAPLKRGVNPFGGIRMARQACEAYGYALSDKIEEEFQYRTTHNDGVFRVYSDEMLAARKAGLITGLPDAYGRGRIIGDYRRMALYGADRLIAAKQADKARIAAGSMNQDTIRLCEELYQQISFLHKLKQMASAYGFDISRPAANAKEAVQWLYFAYLGAIKAQNGAAMSLGRVSTFIDIYMERDLAAGLLTESGAQELIDNFVLKLRLARHLRTPEYNDLFGGDPMWITECVGGMAEDGRTLVTKSSFRFLNTFYNLDSAPEPNITVLWSAALPEPFKRFCAKISVDTDAIQYENDDLMRPEYGDDYGIACCVSAMRLGKQMQYFGARCNLPKLLLLALNGGRDADTGLLLGPRMPVYEGAKLSYDQVMGRFLLYADWMAGLYVNTLNVIHYMHDKYAYEKIQMALHDTEVERVMAFGVAGLSVLADSLSAVRHADVYPQRDQSGLITGFDTRGEYPCFGNDDDRVDLIAADVLRDFCRRLEAIPAYRGAKHTLSVLTITSNVVYGRKTGATPDGRKQGEAFAPGANPMHGRDHSGALASLNSVAKLPYDCCRDGISNTFSIVPDALGRCETERADNLVDILDGYFAQNAHHINVNVLDRKKLMDAYDHPERYPGLTIRVSGYAVHFVKLNREQQREVIRRTFHEAV